MRAFDQFKQKLAARPRLRLALTALAFMALWLLASYLIYRRFPANYQEPNFFGEEGNIWSKILFRDGFFSALGTTFNGYYIWFLYMLEQLAVIVNYLLFGGEFVHLARTFALISYGFLGFVAILPLLLLRNIVKLPALLLTALLIIYVPLGGWDYGVIGALGNIKFELVFVSLILLIYRHYLPAGSKKFYAVDAALLICAYTNITIYVMLPFALLRYWPKLKGKAWLQNIKRLIKRDRSFLSLIILGLALLPQLYVIQHYGIPPMKGYLDSPYNGQRTVEIFIARSYLFEILFTTYKNLNDAVVIISFAAILGLLWKFAKRYRLIIAFSLLTILLTTLLFVSKRTGISEFYLGYKDAGPAQFFFTQNWIFGFVISILVVELISKLRLWQFRLAAYVAVAAGFLAFMAPDSGTWGANNFEARLVGNIYQVSQKACTGSGNTLVIPIYPTPDQKYSGLHRGQLCTASVVHYHPPEVSHGLEPAGNNYLPLDTEVRFTQTFVAANNDLDGLTVYFSTFSRTVHSAYDLRLMDASCKHTVRSVHIRTRSIKDNSYFKVPFEPVADSDGKTYCFTIVAPKPPKDPLAVQLSQPDHYTAGLATVKKQPKAEDIVFTEHYR